MDTAAKYIVPLVAAAAVAGAVVSTTKLIKEKHRAPLYISWQTTYPYFHELLGKSQHVENMIHLACIAPTWCEEFLGRFESCCERYAKMSAALNFCKEQMRIMTITAAEHTSVMWDHATNTSSPAAFVASHGSDLDAIVGWYMDTAAITSKLVFQTAVVLDAFMTESQHLLTGLAEFKNIVRAFNMYWANCGSWIMASPTLAEHSSRSAKKVAADGERVAGAPAVDIKSPQVLTSLKVEVVTRIFESGLESFVAKPTFQHQPQDTTTPALKYNFGSANEMVTSHVQWWALMHTCFVPEMRPVCDALGIGTMPFHSWREMTLRSERASAVAKSARPEGGDAWSTHDTASLGAILKTSTKYQATCSTSSPADIIFSAVALARKGSLLKFIKRPFANLMPSKHTACYIPITSISIKLQNDTVEAMARRIDYMSKSMIEASAAVVDFTDILNAWFVQTIVVPIAIPLHLFRRQSGDLLQGMPNIQRLVADLPASVDARVLAATNFTSSVLLVGIDIQGRKTLSQALRRIRSCDVSQ